MRLILHQSLKDVRLLRPLLLAWLAVLLLRSLLLAYPLDAIVEAIVPEHQVASFGFDALTVGGAYLMLSMAYGALAVVMTVQLVHGDSPVSDTAFWITRPISRATMWSSKLLTAITLLVAVPVLADVAVLAANRLPLRDLFTAGWRGALEHLAFVIPPITLAALTLDLAGFAMACLGLFTAGMASLVLAMALLGPARDSARAGLFVAGVLAIDAGLVITAVQYVTRSRLRSTLLLVLALLVWVASASFWPDAAAYRRPRSSSGDENGRPFAAVTGSEESVGGRRLRVIRTSCDNGSCEVVVRETRAVFAADARPSSRVSYRLLVPRSAAVLDARPGDAVDKVDYLPTGIHIAVTWRWLRFEPPADRPLNASVLAASSLAPVVAADGTTREAR